jgi:hypothetical protein
LLKKNNYRLRYLFIFALVLSIFLSSAKPVQAAAGGQQIKVTACNAVMVVVKGQTVDGTTVKYKLKKDAADCGSNKIRNIYWSGTITLTPYYFVSEEFPSYKGKAITVTISADHQLTDYYAVTVPKPSARQWILWRGSTWVTDKVAYDQNSRRDGYRQDCSGFVSFAWQLTKPGISPAGMSDFSSAISFDNLRPGDALISPYHAMLFVQWVDKSAGTFIAYEEENAANGTRQRTLTLNKSTGVIKQSTYYTYAGRYKAIRLNGL